MTLLGALWATWCGSSRDANNFCMCWVQFGWCGLALNTQWFELRPPPHVKSTAREKPDWSLLKRIHFLCSKDPHISLEPISTKHIKQWNIRSIWWGFYLTSCAPLVLGVDSRTMCWCWGSLGEVLWPFLKKLAASAAAVSSCCFLQEKVAAIITERMCPVVCLGQSNVSSQREDEVEEEEEAQQEQ